MQTPFTIRQPDLVDAGHLCDFNCAMARETEARELDRPTVLRGVSRLMQRPELGFYLVAETPAETPEIAGSLMVTSEWSDWRDGLIWWIQSVYVLPQFRRMGIYRQLYSHVQALADNNPDVCGYRLYVEKDNTIAQTTYKTLGMHETEYLLFEAMR